MRDEKLGSIRELWLIFLVKGQLLTLKKILSLFSAFQVALNVAVESKTEQKLCFLEGQGVNSWLSSGWMCWNVTNCVLGDKSIFAVVEIIVFSGILLHRSLL